MAATLGDSPIARALRGNFSSQRSLPHLAKHFSLGFLFLLRAKKPQTNKNLSGSIPPPRHNACFCLYKAKISDKGHRELLKGKREEIIASLSHFPHFYTKQALKVWRSPLHAVFYWNVKGTSRKKRKNTAGFVASLGAGVQPRSTVQLFMPVCAVEIPPFSQSFLGFGVSFGEEKPFRDQQCQFLTRNKSLSSENESNCSMTSECVRTDSILPRGAGLEHGRCKQSIFSLSIFSILVERLSF